MVRKLLALGCAALAVLVLSAAMTPADARRGGGHGIRGWSGPKSHGRITGGPRFHIRPRSRGHFVYRPRRYIYVVPPAIYGTYAYSECQWLRRRALRTGSPYWWERYYDCIYEY